MVAMTAVLGLMPPLYIVVVPITAQSMGSMLAGGALGARRGGLAMMIFVLLVALGLPLLSGARGGVGVLLGPTAGYLLSWPLAGWVTGKMVEHHWRQLTYLQSMLINILGGMLIVYAAGIGWLSLVLGADFRVSLLQTAIFVPGDLLKCWIAASVTITLRRYYPLIRLNPAAGEHSR